MEILSHSYNIPAADRIGSGFTPFVKPPVDSH